MSRELGANGEYSVQIRLSDTGAKILEEMQMEHPEEALGLKVGDEPMKFKVEVEDDGVLSVNGGEFS